MLSAEKEAELLRFAADIRTECINMISKIGVGHVGGSLSVADALACLYGGILQIDPENPRWPGRDRVVMSKGHAGPAMYAALALKGYFPMEMLNTLNQPPTNLPSHTDMNRTPGVDMTTGSLGQGISTALGMALGGRMAGRENYVYCILGDGECEEGQVWEAAMFASAKKVNRLIALVDQNGRQLDSTLEEIIGSPRFGEKFAAFGWNVLEVEEGNNVRQVWNALEEAKKESIRPTALILHTRKGKGWSYAENLENNHNFKVDAQQAAMAAKEFERQKGSADRAQGV